MNKYKVFLFLLPLWILILGGVTFSIISNREIVIYGHVESYSPSTISNHTSLGQASTNKECLTKSDLKDLQKICENTYKSCKGCEQKVTSLEFQLNELKFKTQSIFDVSTKNLKMLEQLALVSSKDAQASIVIQFIVTILGLGYFAIKMTYLKSENAVSSDYIELVFSYVMTGLIPIIKFIA